MGPSIKNNLQGCGVQEYTLTSLGTQRIRISYFIKHVLSSLVDIKDFVCFVLFVFVRHVFRIVFRFRSSCSLANFLSAKTDLVEGVG